MPEPARSAAISTADALRADWAVLAALAWGDYLKDGPAVTIFDLTLHWDAAQAVLTQPEHAPLRAIVHRG